MFRTFIFLRSDLCSLGGAPDYTVRFVPFPFYPHGRQRGAFGAWPRTAFAIFHRELAAC